MSVVTCSFHRTKNRVETVGGKQLCDSCLQSRGKGGAKFRVNLFVADSRATMKVYEEDYREMAQEIHATSPLIQGACLVSKYEIGVSTPVHARISISTLLRAILLVYLLHSHSNPFRWDSQPCARMLTLLLAFVYFGIVKYIRGMILLIRRLFNSF